MKREFKNLIIGLDDESGMGVVEIVLIIIVLVGLVILFKDKITSLVETLLSKMTSQAKQI
jgi:Sec-independent protein translocase protein TatA